MKNFFENFEKLTKTAAPSGHERELLLFIKNEIQSYCDECRFDNRGNLIAVKKSYRKDAKKLMLTAHSDELGIISTFIEDSGIVRFSWLGGYSPYSVLAKKVRFSNGVVGVISKEKETDFKD